MTTEEFIECWNSCESAAEFSEKTGQSLRSACVRAYRLRKSGNSVKMMPWKIAAPIESRFWSMVEKGDSCWNWTGSLSKKGYGQISKTRNDGPELAHRLSYRLFVGPIPNGIMVLHKCDNPKCVNPSHLFLGTSGDNTQDMVQKERGWWQRNAPHRQILLQKASDDLAEL